jgi:hypothetical protein
LIPIVTLLSILDYAVAAERNAHGLRRAGSRRCPTFAPAEAIAAVAILEVPVIALLTAPSDAITTDCLSGVAADRGGTGAPPPSLEDAGSIAAVPDQLVPVIALLARFHSTVAADARGGEERGDRGSDSSLTQAEAIAAVAVPEVSVVALFAAIPDAVTAARQ